MKKLSLAVLALAASAIAAPAFAQSSVTVFGVIDVNARSVKNDARQSRLDGSGLTSSRLGFRGVEDLGGGLKAGFHLEGAINADDGNASGFDFQRRSTISLMGNFGEVRLGRDKTPNGLMFDDFDPFSNTGMAASGRMATASSVIPVGGRYTNFQRANNSVHYFSPSGAGFFAHAAVAAGEGQLGNKYTGARVGYRTSNWLLSGAYGETQVSPNVDAKLADVGVTYDMKSVKLFGLFARLDMGPASQDTYLLGALMKFGAIDVRASWQQMNGNENIGNQEARKFAVGAAYNLSKRTALYTTYSDISNTNTNFTVATGSGLTRGNDSSGYEVGVRHSF